jgi:metal-responsive CopG/Arc/MetJ family transcriptional regulator
MRRFSVFLDEKSLAKLVKIGLAKGHLKPSQIIRVAIAEYIQREEGKTK